MGKIIQTAHICYAINSADVFYNKVDESINQMQETGLKVEIQYQQSDIGISAFIIGREKNKNIEKEFENTVNRLLEALKEATL